MFKKFEAVPLYVAAFCAAGEASKDDQVSLLRPDVERVKKVTAYLISKGDMPNQ